MIFKKRWYAVLAIEIVCIRSRNADSVTYTLADKHGSCFTSAEVD